MGRSAILSFTSMFSLVPLLVLSVTLINFVLGADLIGKRLENFLLAHLSVINVDEVSAYMRIFIRQASDLSHIGFLFLFISGLLLFLEIETSFDMVWQVGKKRHGLVSTLIHSFLLILLPYMYGFMVLLEYYFPFLSSYFNLVGGFFPDFLAFPIAICVFSLLYKVIPSCYVSFKSSFYGGMVAATLFVIFKKMFIFYFSYFTSYTILYGALAVLPIFMLWLYFSWLIILFGAVVSFVSRDQV
ncbi:MAG: YihY family inner membrane protein [Legionellales bacterium]|jgi:membrane protein|nr:YihY family inner membrane protein [Legionellales bacterium]